MMVDSVDRRGCRWADASRIVGVDEDANKSSSSCSTSSYSSSTTDLRFLRAIISCVHKVDVLDGVAWNDRETALVGIPAQTHRVRAAVTSGRKRLDMVDMYN